MRFGIAALLVLVGTSLPVAAQGQEMDPPAADPQAEKAIAAIQALGGFVSRTPEQQAEDVSMRGRKFTDAHLVLLESLPSVRKLDLDGSRVTDAGLERLLQLPKLQVVSLHRTYVTAAAARSLDDRHPEVIHVGYSPWFQPRKLIFAAVMLIPVGLGALIMRITVRKGAALPMRLYASGIFWGFVLAIGSAMIMLTAIVQAFGIDFHLNDVFG